MKKAQSKPMALSAVDGDKGIKPRGGFRRRKTKPMRTSSPKARSAMVDFGRHARLKSFETA